MVMVLVLIQIRVGVHTQQKDVRYLPVLPCQYFLLTFVKTAQLSPVAKTLRVVISPQPVKNEIHVQY